MKILIVIGSKRKGNSHFIGYELNDKIKSTNGTNHQVTVLDLSKAKIKFCTGCLVCDQTGKCILRDDINKYVDQIVSFDIIIFISPVRWSLPSGEMKTFLDRLNPTATKHSLARKKCISVVVGQSQEGSNDANSVRQASKAFQYFCDNAEMDLLSQYEIYSCLTPCDSVGNEKVNKCINDIVRLIEN